MASRLALTVDYYGTLVENDDAAFRNLCRELGVQLDVGSEDLRDAWLRQFHALQEGAFGTAFEPQRVLQWRALRLVLGNLQRTVDDRWARAACEPLFEMWRAPAPFEDALTFVAAWEGPLCICSNVDNDDLRAAMRSSGLSWDAVVTSEDARAYKPRAEVFNLAVARLAVELADVVHVGDSIGADIAGAQALGLASVWVRRDEKIFPADRDAPTWVVSELATLPELLSKLESP